MFGGAGGGGDIEIDPRFLVLDDSRVQATAFEGPGGNIRIRVGNFILSPQSVVEASSHLGVDGNVIIQGAETNLVGDLAELPATFLVSERLFEQRCAARSGEPVSSLVRAGRGGLQSGPEQALSGFYLANQTLEDPIASKRPSRRAGDELLPEAVEMAPAAAFFECGG